MTSSVAPAHNALIPILTEQSKDCFVDESIKEPDDIIFQGHNFKSGFLKFNKAMSLLDLSQNSDLLNAGVVDTTDSVDCAIGLGQIVFENGNVIDVASLPKSMFIFQVEGDYRLLTLDAEVHDVDHKKFHVFGTVNLQGGTVEIAYRELDGEQLVSKPVGYKLNAKRINHNRINRSEAPQ